MWGEVLEDRITALASKAALKACTHSGFEKQKVPSFSGDILSYYEFKERWEIEVKPESN